VKGKDKRVKLKGLIFNVAGKNIREGLQVMPPVQGAFITATMGQLFIAINKNFPGTV
jgi:hypothetical protein